MLVGASRLRVQVFYPEREKQDLELDLAGFNALYMRALQFDCIPPSVAAERCQYLNDLRKKYSRNSPFIPRDCRRFLDSDRKNSSPPPAK